MNRPRLVLTELREYRSERTGATYFAGYLGKARVVMLRDDRAECTGKEVARWNVLLEESEPRDGRQDRAGGAQDGREGGRTGSAPSRGGNGRPRPSQANSAGPTDRRRTERAVSERKAKDLLRERGIDPGSSVAQDPIPF